MRNYYESMRNCEEFYRNSHHNNVAKLLGGNGFTSRADTEDRAYYVVTRIEKSSKLVIMEIYPSVHCSKVTRAQTAEYLSAINSNYKSSNFRIASNGNVYIHTEQHIDNAPVTCEMFRSMEVTCLAILDTFAEIIDKLAHARLLEPDEADVKKVIEIHRKKISNLLISKLRDELTENDDDDFDTETDDDDKEEENTETHTSGPSLFEEIVRKRRELVKKRISGIGLPTVFDSVADDDESDEDSFCSVPDDDEDDEYGTEDYDGEFDEDDE